MPQEEVKLSALVDSIHKRGGGLALPNKPIDISNVRLLLRSFSAYFESQSETVKTFRIRVRIIFESVRWFYEFRNADWFWDRLREQLQLDAGMNSERLQQTVEAICDARKAWKQIHRHSEPKIHNNARAFIKTIDKVLKKEARRSKSLRSSEQDSKDAWNARASTWPSRFQEFVVSLGGKKPEQPKTSKERSRLVVANGTTTQHDTNIPHSDTHATSRSQSPAAIRSSCSPQGMCPEDTDIQTAPSLPQHPQIIPPGLWYVDLGRNLHGHKPSQSIEASTQNDDDTAIVSAPLEKGSFSDINNDSASLIKSQSDSSSRRETRSSSNVEEHYQAKTSSHGLERHTTDQHDVTKLNENRNQKRQASPLPALKARKKSKPDVGARRTTQRQSVAPAEPVEDCMAESTHRTTSSGTPEIGSNPEQPLESAVGGPLAAAKNVTYGVNDQLTSNADATAPKDSSLMTEAPGPVAVESSIMELLAGYQTKTDAYDFKASLEKRLLQLECQSQRLDKLEALVNKDKGPESSDTTGDNGLHANDRKEKSRNDQVQASANCELGPFLQHIGNQIKNIRHQLRTKIRQEDETTEGWKRMACLGEVAWALDTAIQHAKHGARAVQEPFVQEGSD
ncbi:hypothetical protein PFICI_02084 [Pestalotiopsis fici W106-1]|uniref:Uncharacterized protein n=1 Tax=Pestalotiopsis fici (strain W106-1 / CGMCC3.15140) TaxID=1229662 RepID=W3XST1_PESFW|nr:uncharacterized protein PFICI_02084 [Pestalotiopsis fici W106-1]ETS88256.1 hypothetical protein PFICI_02084 [Pestalotiopsis fici W106-1]